MYDAGQRFGDQIADGLIPVVLHLADHDPGGIDMTRDIEDRLEMFAGEAIEVRRIALNMDQVELYRPPPNFTKDTDNHAAGYRQRLGTDECWEVDALSPTVIADLIRDGLDGMIDASLWQARQPEEENNRIIIANASAKRAKVKKKGGSRIHTP